MRVRSIIDNDDDARLQKERFYDVLRDNERANWTSHSSIKDSSRIRSLDSSIYIEEGSLYTGK